MVPALGRSYARIGNDIFDWYAWPARSGASSFFHRLVSSATPSPANPGPQHLGGLAAAGLVQPSRANFTNSRKRLKGFRPRRLGEHQHDQASRRVHEGAGAVRPAVGIGAVGGDRPAVASSRPADRRSRDWCGSANSAGSLGSFDPSPAMEMKETGHGCGEPTGTLTPTASARPAAPPLGSGRPTTSRATFERLLDDVLAHLIEVLGDLNLTGHEAGPLGFDAGGPQAGGQDSVHLARLS